MLIVFIEPPDTIGEVNRRQVKRDMCVLDIVVIDLADRFQIIPGGLSDTEQSAAFCGDGKVVGLVRFTAPDADPPIPGLYYMRLLKKHKIIMLLNASGASWATPDDDRF